MNEKKGGNQPPFFYFLYCLGSASTKHEPEIILRFNDSLENGKSPHVIALNIQ